MFEDDLVGLDMKLIETKDRGNQFFQVNAARQAVFFGCPVGS